EHGLECEWRPDDSLRTDQLCPGLARHPRGGEVWFNQAHLFHPSGLEPRARETLVALYGEENLPRNAVYGDGSPLPEDELDIIRRAFEAHTVQFRWERGDLLI